MKDDSLVYYSTLYPHPISWEDFNKIPALIRREMINQCKETDSNIIEGFVVDIFKKIMNGQDRVGVEELPSLGEAASLISKNIIEKAKECGLSYRNGEFVLCQ